MARRYVSIWFRFLQADYCALRQPALRSGPFVLASPDHGRMMVRAVNAAALQAGIEAGITVADARTIYAAVEVRDDDPALVDSLLQRLAAWCIRFTPVSAIDGAEGLLLDVSGCAHLWGGEAAYLHDLVQRLQQLGFTVQASMADTIGAAWAMARFTQHPTIVPAGGHIEALQGLPPEALRLEPATTARLRQLGLRRIKRFLSMPRAVLQRRFGTHFLLRLDQALGTATETLTPIQAPAPFEERLPCLEPIVTATGIEMAIEQLLTSLCKRLEQEGKGIRQAVLKAFRVDGAIEQIAIGTHRASLHVAHLFKLFALKIDQVEPALGIELFLLEAVKVEAVEPLQEKIWEGSGGLDDTGLSELIDRLSNRIDINQIHRFAPAEQYWPEWSFRDAPALHGRLPDAWSASRRRPLTLLYQPAPIQVAAPVPDYPPILFRYKGQVHNIKKADGPERIEQAWWLQTGEHRDYYVVEDEAGKRYWVFRSGHYDAHNKTQWYLHGFFA
ncbi:Y-family DNA polymerase [Paraflavitalea pollutisoli]|uniref:Y-family DNA polymerase n=1 Tax=Paraflavitalea pollutisoli TaxID=3034143 RepID=UPI0023EE0260|nr:DNA polymerase Y family protein [Paraflavitalea sp. H1-2-19X]